jgi:elongator complex protein 6
VSLRPLQTGTAKDVTGVIRVTRGGARYDFEGDDQMRRHGNDGEWEALYRVEDGRGKLFNNT